MDPSKNDNDGSPHPHNAHPSAHGHGHGPPPPHGHHPMKHSPYGPPHPYQSPHAPPPPHHNHTPTHGGHGYPSGPHGHGHGPPPQHAPPVNIGGPPVPPPTVTNAHESDMIGKSVRVYWPVDQQWYLGTVQKYDPMSGEHLLRYPDGDEEWVKIGSGAEVAGGGNGVGGAGTSPSKSDKNKGSNNNVSVVGGNNATNGNNMNNSNNTNANANNNTSSNNNNNNKDASSSPDKSNPSTNPNSNYPPYQYPPYGHGPPPHGMHGYPPYGGAPPGPNSSTNSHYPPHGPPPPYGYPPHMHPGMMGTGPNGSHMPGSGMDDRSMNLPGSGGRPAPLPGHMNMPNSDKAKLPGANSGHGATSGSGSGSASQSSANKKKSGPKTWTKEEDALLLTMVQGMRMPMKWSLVAQSMNDRTGKQCRERYVNHLNPRLKSCDWSPVEDAIIFHLYNTCGSQWAKMSKMIPGRTDNGIKNRFHNLRRQLEREDEHRVRLSKPEDFPDEINLDKLRSFPEHLRGKCDGLWNMHNGIGVLAAQSVLGGSFARSASRFGPFKKADADGEQCARCGLFAPSIHTGEMICTKSKWCEACTRIPPHMCGSLLRECLNLRKGQGLDMEKIRAGWTSWPEEEEEKNQ